MGEACASTTLARGQTWVQACAGGKWQIDTYWIGTCMLITAQSAIVVVYSPEDYSIRGLIGGVNNAAHTWWELVHTLPRPARLSFLAIDLKGD